VNTFSPASVGLFFAFEPNKSFHRLMKYNWQQKDQRNFKYDTETIEKLLFEFSERIGRTRVILEGLKRLHKNNYYRDLQNLVKKNILNPIGGERSTQYEILMLN
tara:strand:- start:819 stop:1130 length:312 start_codon:yes stop_codon:yes gene_type:complete